MKTFAEPKNSSRAPGSFREKLFDWFAKEQRGLPWRETSDPYRIWVSEVMLQQTTVRVVTARYARWLTSFPDVESLSQAPLQKVLKAWQGLGYYQRAKNMHRASRIIMEKHKGRIPQTYEELRQLPGFGPYITAAVLSFAFDKPYPVMDANVRRVLMRLKGDPDEARPGKDKSLLEYLAPLFSQDKPGNFNQALMELGEVLCRARNPRCLLCPLKDFCTAFKTGTQEIIPRPKKRNYRKVEAVVAILQKDGKFLIQKRPSRGLLADLWEFPGGKKKTGESLIDALHREIKDELSSEIHKEKFLLNVQHAYTQFQVSLYAYECELKDNPRLREDAHRWVTLRALRRFPVPSGTAKIIQFLEEREKLQEKNEQAE